MRRVVFGLLVSLGLAQPALAEATGKSGGAIVLGNHGNQAGGVLPTISPGEEFAIACGCLHGQRDVRVVLANEAKPDETPLGFRKLLVTEEEIDHDALRVRVPAAPNLSNHTFDVRVYVVGPHSVRACDAGRLRIG